MVSSLPVLTINNNKASAEALVFTKSWILLINITDLVVCLISGSYRICFYTSLSMTPVTVLSSPENDQPNAERSKWKEKAKAKKKSSLL